MAWKINKLEINLENHDEILSKEIFNRIIELKKEREQLEWLLLQQALNRPTKMQGIIENITE
jgi:hypothetical protein